jgi:hypothetical protein
MFGCAPPDVGSAPEDLTGAELASFLRGRDLFLNETFDGNDRTCSSCHLRRFIGDNFDFTPADAQAIFAADPTDPLFRSIDADDGVMDFTTLRTHGLARIPFVLPPNIIVLEPSGPTLQHNADGTTTVFVLRSTPSIENMALEEHIMWDGREGADLAHQAGSAVQTHYQPGRLPTQAEKDDIAFFQQQFFTNLQLRVFAAGGPPPTLPQVPSWLHGPEWDRARAGRRFFVDMPIVASADPLLRGGHCATCHSGPMLDTTNSFNPVSPAGLKTNNNNTTSEVNAIALPALTYQITAPRDIFFPAGIPPLPFFPPAGTPLFTAGTVFTVHSPDLGNIYTTGDPCPPGAEVFCFISTFLVGGGVPTSQSFFRNSSLWGAGDTAPYFHDNSCGDLECVMAHYQNNIFLPTAFATGNPGWNLSADEQAQIIEYMQRFLIRTTLL